MTVKQQTNHGTNKLMCVTYIMVFFIPFIHFILCQFYSVLFNKNNKLWTETKVYMDASAYIVIAKEVENRIFRHNGIFTHMYVQTTHTDKVMEL